MRQCLRKGHFCGQDNKVGVNVRINVWFSAMSISGNACTLYGVNVKVIVRLSVTANLWLSIVLFFYGKWERLQLYICQGQ